MVDAFIGVKLPPVELTGWEMGANASEGDSIAGSRMVGTRRRAATVEGGVSWHGGIGEAGTIEEAPPIQGLQK